MTDQDWSALAAEVRRRRERFRLPQDLAPRGGPSEFTVHKIEAGTAGGSIRPHTKTRLEHALRMPSGLVDKILDGTATEEDLDEEVAGRDASDWAALADAVRQRRTALRVRQSDLEALGGPSAGTVKNIEQAARSKYSARTFSQLETALSWPPGAARKILDGHDIEDEADSAPSAASPCACVVGSPAWIDRELATERRINAIAQVFQSEMQRLLALVEAARRG